MRQFVIFLENMNDVTISDIQELNNTMYYSSLNDSPAVKPLVDNKIYYVKEYVKIIEIDYSDMYIKVLNEQGSTLIGQIIEGFDIEFNIPADIYIEYYKKDKESYDLYAKY